MSLVAFLRWLDELSDAEEKDKRIISDWAAKWMGECGVDAEYEDEEVNVDE